jgi:flagellar motor switch protein FliM
LSEILSQSELDSLLNSLGNEQGGIQLLGTKSAGHGQTSRHARSTHVQYEDYDFRRPDKLSKDQLRTLSMLHDTFARGAGSAASAATRSSVGIEMISMEQIPYDEYLRSINSSVFAIISLPPLTGQIVLEMESSLVLALIDRMLGGPGKPIERSVLTDIERPLAKNLMSRILAALKQSWESVVVVSPTVDGLETSTQFVSIAPPNDIVLVILFEVKVGDVRTAMSLCIPYLVLKPITAKLSAQRWFSTTNRRQSVQARRLMTDQVTATEVDCTVVLGSTQMPFEELLALKSGDVLRLDQMV